MKRAICLLLTGCLAFSLAACAKSEPQQETTAELPKTETTAPESSVSEETEEQKESIDYLVLVNKLNKLPDGWEDALETVTVTNSVGDEVEVEKKTYNAYLHLKDDLENNDGIYLELDSGRRTVAEQQDIMDRFKEKYGEDYAAKTVAQPGFSEHHTGLAIDLYFRVKNENGTFTDVYNNEDMVLYPEIWAKIHERMTDYGFILRYLEGSEHLTGYGYEPWHLRYVDSAATAADIMNRGITLEEYLGAVRSYPVSVDLGSSELYSDEELNEAVVQIKCRFASWGGCELHAIRYDGDEADNEENREWLSSMNAGAEYVDVAKFVIDFHSPLIGNISWDADVEYTDYEFWLARTEDGGWDIACIGQQE